MADNFLITGYWGEPHVTSENDRGLNAAMFGAGKYVLSVGKQFKAEYVGNNTVRLYDGKLVDNGAAGGIPAGEYVDLTISNAGQGKKRNDLIVFEYSKNASSLIEKGVFKVIQGTETADTPGDPSLKTADLLSGTATKDQMPLWRVPVNATTISAPEQVFLLREPYAEVGKTQAITTAGTDLNDYTATGIYFFSSDYTPANIPGGSNGWLIVLNQNEADSGVHVKQLWLRSGTAGSNDHQTWVRTKTSIGGTPTWGSWNKLITSMDTIAIVNGGTGATTAATARSNLGLGKLATLDTVPVANGGTGATNGATGLKNLLAAGNTVVSSYQYGTSLPAAGTKGRIFFKKVT